MAEIKRIHAKIRRRIFGPPPKDKYQRVLSVKMDHLSTTNPIKAGGLKRGYL